ncbi:hypothetical protein [Zobellella maritima]|uniref:hypothetical protein n=1 Tax=Zobellella maritima TaxID=2059725 RepID=UPI000E3055BB|nr:hypothetical protein [Zobellella maritima]
MSSQDIIAAIHSLISEGKSVSTAAVRARMSGPVNMASLIQLVNQYKQSPASLTPMAEPAQTQVMQQASQEQRIAELEARVARLEQLLAGKAG